MAQPRPPAREPELPRGIWNGTILARRETAPPGASDAGLNHFHLLTYVHSGSVRYGGRKENFLAQPRDLILTSAHVLHQWRVVGNRPWRVTCCVFAPRPEWTRLLAHPNIIPGYAAIPMRLPAQRKSLEQCLATLCRLDQSKRDCRSELMYAYLEIALIWARDSSRLMATTWDPRVQLAVDYLIQNLNKPVTLEELAAHCGLSRARLFALFTSEIGMTPRDFHESRQLERAMELLKLTDNKLYPIGLEVGFDDVKYFIRRFKRRLGLTPLAYRAKSRQSP